MNAITLKWTPPHTGNDYHVVCWMVIACWGHEPVPGTQMFLGIYCVMSFCNRSHADKYISQGSEIKTSWTQDEVDDGYESRPTTGWIINCRPIYSERENCLTIVSLWSGYCGLGYIFKWLSKHFIFERFFGSLYFVLDIQPLPLELETPKQATSWRH